MGDFHTAVTNPKRMSDSSLKRIQRLIETNSTLKRMQRFNLLNQSNWTHTPDMKIFYKVLTSDEVQKTKNS